GSRSGAGASGSTGRRRSTAGPVPRAAARTASTAASSSPAEPASIASGTPPPTTIVPSLRCTAAGRPCTRAWAAAMVAAAPASSTGTTRTPASSAPYTASTPATRSTRATKRPMVTLKPAPGRAAGRAPARRSRRGRSLLGDERPLDEGVELGQRQPLGGVLGVGDHGGVHRLVRGHEAGEEAGQHLGVAGQKLAHPLAPAEQVGLQPHRLVVVGRHDRVDLAVVGHHRGARVPQVEAAEAGVGPEEPDLEVDQPVELLGGRALVAEGVAQPRHELVAAAHEDLAEEVVLVLEERVHGTHRELGQLGHLLEGGLVEALAPEHLLGGIEQLATAE